MALFSTTHLDCVVAIGKTDPDGKTQWFASGFLMGRFIKKRDDTTSSYNVYLVTNRHVVDGLKSIQLRFNPKAASSAAELGLDLFDPSGGSMCYYPHDPNIDVAVVPINANVLDQLGMQFDYFRGNNQVANKAKLSQLGVSEGDFVYVLGFPLGMVGVQRSYVIARIGVIARIREMLAGYMNDYLIDCPVFPGNSGGPVITKPEVFAVRGTTPVNDSLLIGVVKSYVVYEELALSSQTGLPRIKFEENSGLTTAVPIDFVEEAIELHIAAHPIPPES